MAVTRNPTCDKEDAVFVNKVIFHLFQLGWLNPATADVCLGVCCDTLCSIALAHPSTISVIVHHIGDISVGEAQTEV